MTEQLYTFGLVYPPSVCGGGIEEIDVRARTHSEAVALAKSEAERDYMPGWTHLIEMAPGGTGGHVEVWHA